MLRLFLLEFHSYYKILSSYCTIRLELFSIVLRFDKVNLHLECLIRMTEQYRFFIVSFDRPGSSLEIQAHFPPYFRKSSTIFSSSSSVHGLCRMSGLSLSFHLFLIPTTVFSGKNFAIVFQSLSNCCYNLCNNTSSCIVHRFRIQLGFSSCLSGEKTVSSISCSELVCRKGSISSRPQSTILSIYYLNEVLV